MLLWTLTNLNPLIFSSPEPKAQVDFSNQNYHYLSLLSQFCLLLQNHFAQNILGWWGFKLVQMKDLAFFQGEIIISHKLKMQWQLNFKKSSSNRANFNQTCQKTYFEIGMKSIQMRDNTFFKEEMIAKFSYQHLKIPFSRNTGLITPIFFFTKQPSVMGSRLGPCPFPKKGGGGGGF